MAVAGPSLIVLLVGATLLLGGLALVVALLVNPKTRWIVLGLVGLVVLVMTVSFAGLRMQGVEIQQQRSRLVQMQQDIAHDIAEAHDAGPGGSHTEDGASHNPAPSEQELSQMRVRVQELEAELAELGAHGVQPVTPQDRLYSHRVSAFGILAVVAVLVVIVLLVKAAPGVTLVGLSAVALIGMTMWFAAATPQLARAPLSRAVATEVLMPVDAEQIALEAPAADQIVVSEDEEQNARAGEIAPDWIENPPTWESSDGGCRRVVETDWFVSDEGVQQDLNRRVLEVVAERLSELMGERVAVDAMVGAIGPELMIGPSNPTGNFIDQTHSAVAETSVGRVKKEFALVVVSDTMAQKMRSGWSAVQQSGRVSSVAKMGVGVLGLVALALGLVKLDQSTGQRYTKRLLIGLPAVIIGLAAVLAVLA